MTEPPSGEDRKSIPHFLDAEHIGLSARAKVFALESMKKIIRAESRVHGERFNNVYLHESSLIPSLT